MRTLESDRIGLLEDRLRVLQLEANRDLGKYETHNLARMTDDGLSQGEAETAWQQLITRQRLEDLKTVIQLKFALSDASVLRDIHATNKIYDRLLRSSFTQSELPSLKGLRFTPAAAAEATNFCLMTNQNTEFLQILRSAEFTFSDGPPKEIEGMARYHNALRRALIDVFWGIPMAPGLDELFRKFFQKFQPNLIYPEILQAIEAGNSIRTFEKMAIVLQETPKFHSDFDLAVNWEMISVLALAHQRGLTADAHEHLSRKLQHFLPLELLDFFDVIWPRLQAGDS